MVQSGMMPKSWRGLQRRRGGAWCPDAALLFARPPAKGEPWHVLLTLTQCSRVHNADAGAGVDKCRHNMIMQGNMVMNKGQRIW